MSRYGKISSGSGSHGVKYEVNLLSFYLLKAYISNEDFQLSTGEKAKLKLNDIILESNTYTILAQAKHIDNKSKKITRSQLFAENGRYSLYVYMKEAYCGIYLQLLHNICEVLEEEVICLKKSKATQDTSKLSIETLYIELSNQIQDSRESSFENLILSLKEVNIEKVNSLLKSFNNTNFHLVTNISPNEELTKFKTQNLPDFKEFTECYNFNANECLTEILKLKYQLKIPEWFINIFLEKTYLIVTSNEVLKANIISFLEQVSSRREISHEISYDEIYSIIEEWQSKKDGVYMTRSEIDDAYFAYRINTSVKQELRSYEGLIELNIQFLLESIDRNLLTIVETPRYLLMMTALQKHFHENKIVQTLFVSPFLNIENQRFLMKAFLHEKYTHLVCVLQNGLPDLLAFFLEVLGKIEQNKTLNMYKKVILFCDEHMEMWKSINEVILRDRAWFKDRKLNIQKFQYSLGDLESYYIERELSCGHIVYSETNFFNKAVDNGNYVLISDSPGMGKTSLLASLAVKINKNGYYLPVIIHLNSFTDILEKHLEAKTVPQLHDFLKIMTKSSFERQICLVPYILFVMIDGFDEISPDYSDIIKDFLKNIYSSRCVQSVTITTRNHMQDFLENNLGYVDTFRLQPLQGRDVCSLMCRLGKQNFDNVSNWYDSLPQNVQDFLVIPLHAKMFAESSKLNNISAQATLNINLYDLYDHFVNEKKNIFIKEKCNSQGNIHVKKAQNEYFNNLLNVFVQLALEMTFKRELLEDLGATGTSNEFSQEMCANGILEICNETVRFVHETFKEFLVSKWILKKLFDSDEYNFDDIEVFFKRIFMKSYGSKVFINAYLEKNWNSLTNACLMKFADIASKNRTFSDILYVNYDFPFIIRLMVEKCENQVLLNKIFVDLISLGSDHFIEKDLISFLINKGVDARAKNDKGKTILHVAAEKGNFELVRYLVENNICHMDECDNVGLTAIVLALFNYKFDIAEYLLAHRTCVTEVFKAKLPLIYNPATRAVSICYGFTYYVHRFREQYMQANLLHTAAYQGNLRLFKLVLSHKACNINDKTSEEDNVLHCAVESGNLDLIEYIISLGVDPHTTTSNGNTVLHLAVRNDNMDLVKYFVHLNIKIDAKTNFDETALEIASMYSKWDIIKYLLEMYMKLGSRDISSVHKGLCALLQKKEYNEFFKRVYGKYKYQFLSTMKSGILEEATRCKNTDLENYLSKQQQCNIF